MLNGLGRGQWRNSSPTSVLCLVLIGASSCCAQSVQRNVSLNWDFTTAADTLGWSPIAPLSNFGVRDGALTFSAKSNVNVVYSPAISIAGAARQRVELVMKSDTAGAA